MLRLGSFTAAMAALVIATSVQAAGNGEGHGIGVLNTVDTASSKVNITHGPIPALQWPEMTMDLPVTDDVDLDDFGKGDKVQFTVEMNDKKVYEIVAMCATGKDEVTEGLCGGHGRDDGHHDDQGHHDGDHHDDGHHADDDHHNGHHDGDHHGH